MNALKVAVATTLAVCTSTAWGVPTKIIAGGKDEVCHAIKDLSRKVSEEEYKSGIWRERFGSIDWKHDTYPTITAEKRPWDVPYKYVYVDIDNDGRQDVVVVYSGMIRSVDFDWLYLFTPEKFQQAQLEKTVFKLFESGPFLNPHNEVKFSSGVTAVPVELQIWHHKGTRYLLLKEHFFPWRKAGPPHSLVVAKLSRTSLKWYEPLKLYRLVPDLKCRLVSQ